MSDSLTELQKVHKLRGDTYSSAEVWDLVGWAAAEIERLRAVLEEIAAITILPVAGYQKKAVQIARKALANEEGLAMREVTNLRGALYRKLMAAKEGK
jgi:hypothetical protein